MTVSQVKEALGNFSLKLKSDVPRDVLDKIEYFGHIAVIPGRGFDARIYGDNTLDSARYVGVVRKRKITDTGTFGSDVANTSFSVEGVGMNFWLGDEEDKGSVIENEISYISANFSTAISGLLPPAVTAGTIGGVSGTYSGVHQWQTPRKAIQYVCDTMSQPADPFNLVSTANSSMETSAGVSGWTATTNCSIAVTGAYSYLGVQSMKVTPTAAGAVKVTSNGTGNTIALTAGSTYVAYYWVLSTGVSTYAKVDIDYRDVGYGAQGSAPADTFVALPQNAWTQISRTFTVPTGAGITRADMVLNLSANSSADRFYVDNVWGYLSTVETPVSYRVNNRGALDAGPESNLYVTTPQCVVVRHGSMQGEDLTVKAVPGTIGLDQDMEDFSTRIVVLAGSDGLQFSTGTSDIGTISPGTNSYKDIHGNPLRMTRMMSESQTTEDNADTRAELALRELITPHREVSLNTDDYDVFGSFDVGDYIYCYDPDGGLVDTANELVIRGIRINPIKLQVTELEWPVTDDYSVAYRAYDGTWYDLTQYIAYDEDGATRVTIGDFKRTLDSNLQDVTQRLGSNLAPDNLTPGQTSWITGSFQAVAYLDKSGLARAQQKVAWLTPTNTDGTAITDGDHYEIQYKLNTGHLYSQTWGAVNNITWGAMNTWGQPVQASAVDWETRQVAWGTNALIINDLACGTAYDYRIRAVDSSNNLGAWSSTETVVAAEDDIPPTQPAVASVASSLIAVQITHYLGMNSGGTFNLERDLAYLEVHAQYEPGYTPDDTTKLGNLLANSAMMDAQTPVVGTFQISDTTDVYIKVVAVDKSGNRSQPSPAVQSSAALIDDAHISNLSVSKITAGEVTADWIVSGSIKTGVDGQRLELNPSGLQAFNVDGDLVTNLSSNPQTDGSYIAFVDTTGKTLAGINSQGAGSFTSVNTDLIHIEGVDLMGDIINPRGKGVVAWGYSLTDVGCVAGVTKGYMELAFTAEANRMYRVTCTADMNAAVNDPNDDNRHYFQIRDGGTNVPTVVSPSISSCFFKAMDHGTYNTTGYYMDMRTYTPGLHRLLWCFGCLNTDATLSGSSGPSQFFIEDMGDVSLFNNTGYLNPGDGSTTAPDNSGNFGTVYNATWTRSYAGDDSLRDNYAINDRLYHGRYDSNYGQQKSLIGFDYNGIAADLAGATVTRLEVYLYSDHWYNDSGTVHIGTHNYTGIPSTWNSGNVDQNSNQGRVYVDNWPTGAGYWIDIPVGIAAEFLSGTSRGISLGPVTSTDHVYYGYFRGGTGSNCPKLRITYTK